MKIDGISITGITCDSRKVKKGYAFVAIKGNSLDGNDYINEAINNGAAVIYTENEINQFKTPVIKVENCRKKLAILLNEFYDFPSEKMKIIGVTGTNGKTTTTNLIFDIFRKAGFKTGLIGTLGIKENDKYINSSLTTPDSEVLYKTLSDFVKSDIEVVVMEVSSHGLKLYRDYGLDYDIAIHTNIEKDHMNLHKTLEDYILTKKKLFDYLDRNKLAIINTDDQNSIRLLQDNSKPIVLNYGLNNYCTLTASSMILKDKIEFNVCLQREITTINGLEIEPLEFPIHSNLMGKHNVYNILASIGVALYFGIEPETIQNALSSFKGIHRRLEKIYEGDFMVIDDFCHNPASYQAILETIQGLNYNRLIIINSIRGNRGIEINEENANTLAKFAPILGDIEFILSLSEDVVGTKDKVSEDEASIYKEIFNQKEITYKICNTLHNSIKYALDIANKNDIILLFGAQGMDKGKDILFNLLKEA